LQLLYPSQSCCISQGLAGTHRTFFSLTLHVSWICFCNQIGIYIYVVSFFVQLQSRWLEHCCWSCKHIWEALLLLLEGMLFFFFWLNKIWDLQLRKTSYLLSRQHHLLLSWYLVTFVLIPTITVVSNIICNLPLCTRVPFAG
jgi:hypothetical protein